MSDYFDQLFLFCCSHQDRSVYLCTTFLACTTSSTWSQRSKH